MTTNRRNLRLAAVTAIAVAVLAVGTGVAWAADQGNWDGVTCGDRGEICNWREDYGSGRKNTSSTRDSNYNGDYYGNLSSWPMGDHVKNYSNSFGTLKVRSYHQQDYVQGSTCLNPGFVVGPYSIGTSNGLSSFKSC